jgi:DHA1 family bicyclomycin/chloramphenicol resistance-like MFS transporter
MNDDARNPADAVRPGAAPSPHAPLSLREFVATLAAMIALNALATDIMLPAFPQIQADLGGVPDNRIQAIVTAFMAGFAISHIFMGFLADRYGRRPVLIGGLAVYAIASVFTALAGDFTWMLVARFVQGLGSGAPRVVATAAARDCYSGRAMARVMSLVMTVFMAVPILAPSIGQAILLLSHWRYVMAFLAFYAIVLLAVTAWRFPETLPVERRRAIGWTNIRAALASIFLSRQTIGYALAASFIFAPFFGFIGSAQQIMVGVFGLGVWFPLAFASLAGMLAISSFVNSRLVERHGMRRLSHFATIVFTLASVALALFGYSGMLVLPIFITLMAVNMAMVGMVFSNFNALALETQGHVAGVASAFVGSITTGFAAGFGYFISALFDGTVTPLAESFAIFGMLTILTIAITEKGRLFQAGSRH